MPSRPIVAVSTVDPSLNVVSSEMTAVVGKKTRSEPAPGRLDRLLGFDVQDGHARQDLIALGGGEASEELVIGRPLRPHVCGHWSSPLLDPRIARHVTVGLVRFRTDAVRTSGYGGSVQNGLRESSQMRFRAERPDRSRLVRLFGELDASTADELRTVLEPMVDARGDIELDCAELTFMDSSGLHVLLIVARALGRGGRVIARNPNRTVRRILSLCGVERSGGIFVATGDAR